MSKPYFEAKILKQYSHFQKVKSPSFHGQDTADCFIPSSCAGCKTPAMQEGHTTVVLYQMAQPTLEKKYKLKPCPKGGGRVALLEGGLCEECWLEANV